MLRMLAAGLAALSLTAVAADAAGAATYNRSWLTLNLGPNRVEQRQVKTRTITLNGRYSFTACSRFVRSSTPATGTPRRWLRLKGRYRWRDWLSRWGSGYIHHADLRNTATGELRDIMYLEPGRRGNGRYLIGSALVNERAPFKLNSRYACGS